MDPNQMLTGCLTLTAFEAFRPIMVSAWIRWGKRKKSDGLNILPIFITPVLEEFIFLDY